MSKLKIIIIMIICLIGNNIYAQDDCIEGKGIITDPRSPVNTENPNLKNKFYWFQTTNTATQFDNTIFNYVGLNATASQMSNPYTQFLKYPFALTDNTSGNDFSDYLPDNGWELIKHDFGYLQNGTLRDDAAATGKKLIYFVLYNKYTGIMRFMGAMPEVDNDYKTIKFNVRLLRTDEVDPSKSQAFKEEFTLEPGAGQLQTARLKYETRNLQGTNILSIANGVMKPLDKKTSDIHFSVMAQNPGDDNRYTWFYFEMPVAYDPCICHNQSAIALSYEQIKVWNVKLTGTAQGNYTANEAAKSTDCSTIIPERIIGGAFGIGKAIATSGAYLDLGSFIGLMDIVQCIPGIDDKTKKVVKQTKQLLKATSDLVVVKDADSWKKNKFNSWKDLSVDMSGSPNPIPYSLEEIAKRKELYGERLKKNVEVMTRYSQFFSTAYDFKTLDKSAEVNKAGGNQNNIALTVDLKGEITDNKFNSEDILWSVPGSKTIWNLPGVPPNNVATIYEQPSINNSGKSMPEIPLYNEALGVIAFLQTPKLNLAFGKPADDLPSWPSGHAFFQYLQFNLMEDLKFTFNPKCNVNLENTMIACSFELVQEKIITSDNKPVKTNIMHKFFDAKSSINIKKSAINNHLFSPLVDINNIREMYCKAVSSVGYDLSTLKIFMKIFVSLESKNLDKKGNPIKSTSSYTIPVDIAEMGNLFNYQFNDEIINMVLQENNNVLTIDAAYISSLSSSQTEIFHDGPIKITVNLPNNIIKVISTNYVIAEPNITYNNSCIFQKYVLFINQNFVNIMNIGQKTIFHDGPIIISANLPNSIDRVISSELIDVLPNVTINPKCILEINDEPFTNKYPQSPVSTDFVRNFCNKIPQEGIDYIADEFLSERLQNLVNYAIKKTSTHSLQIFPNPASSIFNIQLSEADITNTSAVNLYDITGHLISQNKGYIKTISTEALANGTYIVEVILNDNTKMNQRLVVTH